MLSLSVPAAALANGSLHIVGGRYQVPPAGDEASVLQTELAAEACRICAPAHAKRISIDREGCRDRAGCSGATALVPKSAPRPADVPPRPAPFATAWIHVPSAWISMGQQASQEVLVSWRHAARGLREQGIDVYD